MYFCPTCKRNHRPSKSSIYQKHIKFKKVEADEIPSDKVISYNFESLPEVAKRQIKRYAHKILVDKERNYSKWREVYIKEINKIILHETPDSFMIK